MDNRRTNRTSSHTQKSQTSQKRSSSQPQQSRTGQKSTQSANSSQSQKNNSQKQLESKSLSPIARLEIILLFVALSILPLILYWVDVFSTAVTVINILVVGVAAAGVMAIESRIYRGVLGIFIRGGAVLTTGTALFYHLVFGFDGWFSNPNLHWIVIAIALNLLFLVGGLYTSSRKVNPVPELGIMLVLYWFMVAVGSFAEWDFITTISERHVVMLSGLSLVYALVHKVSLTQHPALKDDGEGERNGWKYAVGISLIALLFLGFGTYHLGQFMSVDEPKWVRDRVPQLYEAIEERNWEDTYINDKPGALPSYLAGIVNFYLDQEEWEQDPVNYEIYLYWWRLPIVVFNMVMIFLIYHFTSYLFGRMNALFVTGLIALNPVLIGISQIVNPDATLWSVGFISFITFFLYLQTNSLRYVFYSGLFLGLGLLSKYFISIFFLVFFIAIYLDYLIYKRSIQEFYQRCFDFFILTIVSIIMYTVFFPVTWVEPMQILKGTIGAGLLSPGFTYIFLFVTMVLFEMIVLRGRVTTWIRERISIGHVGIFISSLVVFGGVVILISNIVFDNYVFDFNTYRLQEYERAQVDFWGDLLSSSYSTILTLSFPILLGVVLFGVNYLRPLRKFFTQNQLFIFVGFIIIFLFHLGAPLGGYITAARYQILLYPIYVCLAFFTFMQIVPLRYKNYAMGTIGAISVIVTLTSAPFYYHFENSLNYRDYLVTEAWGFGGYEMADYLNNKENIGSLNIFVDREGTKRFFQGNKVYWRGGANPFWEDKNIDYMVLTSGGKRIYTSALQAYIDGNRSLYAKVAKRTPMLEYYEKEPEFEICLQGNSNNCIWVVPFEDKHQDIYGDYEVDPRDFLDE